MSVNPSVTTGSSIDVESVVDDVAAWLRRQLDASGARTFVLALSGGIDSAVVCGLCERAAGAGRVLCVVMPSSSNPDDAVQAAKVADRFKVRTLTVDLTELTDSFYAAMPTIDDISAIPTDIDTGGERRQQLATANARPRLRMTTVYYTANLAQGIVVGTGNKSEAKIGYFTKYGDGGVDLLPIIDLYKHEVRDVARFLGVPQSVIDRAPSAGLWDGQTDEAEIGMTYDELDAILIGLERGSTDGLDADMVAKVQGMMTVSDHKRSPIPMYLRD